MWRTKGKWGKALGRGAGGRGGQCLDIEDEKAPLGGAPRPRPGGDRIKESVDIASLEFGKAARRELKEELVFWRLSDLLFW